MELRLTREVEMGEREGWRGGEEEQYRGGE